MKIEIEVDDSLVDSAIDTIMSEHPNVQKEVPCTLLCTHVDRLGYVYKFFDKHTSKQYILTKDSLRHAFSQLMSAPWVGNGRTTLNINDVQGWASELGFNEINYFTQLACMGEIPYD